MQPEQQKLLRRYHDVMQHPVRGANYRDVIKVAPYLSQSQARAMIMAAHTFDDNTATTIVGPPIAVQGALHIFVLRCQQDGMPILHYDHSSRRSVSYPNGPPAGARFRRYKYEEAAQNYASVHWGEQLVWDRAVAKVVFVIAAPPIGAGLADGAAWLTEEFPQMFMHGEEPESQILDDAIVRSEAGVLCGSWGTIVNCELLGHTLPVALFFCSLCGGGVNSTRCTCCGAAFRHHQSRNQAPTHFPLPWTMATICPRVFPTDPALGRLKETETWARNKRVALTKPSPHVERQRVIQVD